MSELSNNQVHLNLFEKAFNDLKNSNEIVNQFFDLENSFSRIS